MDAKCSSSVKRPTAVRDPVTELFLQDVRGAFVVKAGDELGVRAIFDRPRRADEKNGLC
jgi:hypothetical protein